MQSYVFLGSWNDPPPPIMRGAAFMKNPSYSWHELVSVPKKIDIIRSFRVQYRWHRPWHSKGKNEICSKWKAKKLIGFSFYINIKNFEAFFQNLNLSTKHLFWRCDIGGFQFQNWFSNSNLGIPRLGNWLL